MRERDRRALRTADAEQRHAHTRSARTRGCGTCACIDAIGEQYDLAVAYAALLQQLHAEIDRPARRIARCRHHGRIERIDEIGDGIGIVGQRRDDEGVAGIGDQRCLRIGTALQDIGDLESCAREAAWLYILREHRLRQFERDHARGLVLIQRLRQTFPCGAGEGERRQRPCRECEPARRARRRGGGVTRHDQMRKQMRIDRTAPRIRIAAGRMQRAPQQRQRKQCDKPPRPQKM